MQFYLRALSYFRQDWPLIVCLIGVIGISTALGLLMAWPFAILVDSVLGTSSGQDWMHRLFLAPLPESRLGQILGLALAGLLLKLCGDLLSTVQTLLWNQINYNGLTRVRCDLYRKLQVLSLAYHRSRPQGDAIYRLTSDAFGCQTILGVLVSAVIAVVMLGAMAAVLISRSVPLTLAALAIAPALAVVNIFFSRRFHHHSLECKERDTHFTTVVQRSLSSVGLVQAFGRESYEFDEFHSSISKTIQAWWRLNRQQISYNLIVGGLFGIGGTVVFAYGGYLVYRDQYLQGGGGMTVGDLMVFMSYLAMLWGPLCTLTGFSASLQSGVAGAERVFDVLDRDACIVDAPDAVHLPRRPRVLEFRDVCFSYEPQKPILRNISLKIKPGQMVAIVGSSGVGKSSLLNLLPRFYDAASGSILLDGTDVRQVKVKDLRRHVALVLQESVILPTTIAENIAYGAPNATEEQVRHAARLAGAEEFIEQLPEGYDTQVAEGGQNLSGGQRQRIAIARALLTNAPFLVLDEPTSALDPHHERIVTEALRSLKGRRTIIIVSHRLSTVADCDQIYVMEEGRIVEHGTHEDLLAHRGAYFAMARQQLKLEDEALSYAA